MRNHVLFAKTNLIQSMIERKLLLRDKNCLSVASGWKRNRRNHCCDFCVYFVLIFLETFSLPLSTNGEIKLMQFFSSFQLRARQQNYCFLFALLFFSWLKIKAKRMKKKVINFFCCFLYTRRDFVEVVCRSKWDSFHALLNISTETLLSFTFILSFTAPLSFLSRNNSGFDVILEQFVLNIIHIFVL